MENLMNLEIRRGRANNNLRIVSKPVFLVGANPDCDMVLGDPQFGPIHFFLLNRNGKTTIGRVADEPQITVNGNDRLNGGLEDGDRIRTGPYEFVVRAA